MTERNFGTHPFSRYGSADQSNRGSRPGTDSSRPSDLPIDLIEGLVRPAPESGGFLDDFEAFDDIGTLTHNPFSPAPTDPFRLDAYPEDDEFVQYARNPLKTNPVLRGSLIGTGSLAITLAIGSTLSDQHNFGLTTGAIQPIDSTTVETAESALNEVVSETLPPQVKAAITDAVEFSSSAKPTAPSAVQGASIELPPAAFPKITSRPAPTQQAAAPAGASGLEQDMRNLEQVLKRIESLPIPVVNYSTPPAIGANLPQVPIPARDRPTVRPSIAGSPQARPASQTTPAVPAVVETSLNSGTHVNTEPNPGLDPTPRTQPVSAAPSSTLTPSVPSTPSHSQPAVSMDRAVDWSAELEPELEPELGTNLGAANVSPPEPWISAPINAPAAPASVTTTETVPSAFTDPAPVAP